MDNKKARAALAFVETFGGGICISGCDAKIATSPEGLKKMMQELSIPENNERRRKLEQRLRTGSCILLDEFIEAVAQLIP